MDCGACVVPAWGQSLGRAGKVLFVWQLFCSVFVILPPSSVRPFLHSLMPLFAARTEEHVSLVLLQGPSKNVCLHDLMCRTTLMPHEPSLNRCMSARGLISVRAQYRKELERQYIGLPCKR